MTDLLKNVAVIGAGSWGTGFAAHLGALGHKVRIWAREPEIVYGINTTHMNPLFNTLAAIKGDVRAFESIAETLEGAQIAAVAVPSRFLPEVSTIVARNWNRGCVYLCLTKGLCGDPPEFISDYVMRTLPFVGTSSYAVLSGPNLASEIAAGKPAAAVVASENDDLACTIQEITSGNNFRVYTSNDVAGVEVGGSVKNIVAIAAGIVDGLKLGVNARSVLITRGLVEMTRFAVKLGAKRETLSGLSGLGDLVTTCSSRESRNFTVGVRLAAGESLAEIESSMKMVAEGVTTARAVYAKARDIGVDMPITEQVYLILDEGKPVRTAVNDLMTRVLKPEESV